MGESCGSEQHGVSQAPEAQECRAKNSWQACSVALQQAGVRPERHQRLTQHEVLLLSAAASLGCLGCL